MRVGALVGFHPVQLAGYARTVTAAARRKVRQPEIAAIEIRFAPVGDGRRSLGREGARTRGSEWRVADTARRLISGNRGAQLDLAQNVLAREVLAQKLEAAGPEAGYVSAIEGGRIDHAEISIETHQRGARRNTGRARRRL